MKILLLGSNGQVGWELQRALAPLGSLVVFGRHTANFEQPETLRRLVEQEKPAIIVNAAAYTAVDKAESDVECARRVNAESVAELAAAAHAVGAWLVHYSTDYVFAGDKPSAYVEDDPTAPLNVYGQTKLEGEEAIRASQCRHLILRTSWVYAARGGNFAKTMLRLAADRNELRVVADQFGAPTSAELIADVTALILQQIIASPTQADSVCGTYHLVASGVTSWHGYAQFVIGEASRLGMVLKATPQSIYPIPAAEYPVPAQRPANSRLDNQKLQKTFGLRLPEWELHAKRMLTELNS